MPGDEEAGHIETATTDPPQSPAAGADAAGQEPEVRPGARLVVLWTCLSMAAVWLAWPRGGPITEAPTIASVRSTLDPNSAPWWELSALPNIGPALADEIVRYRESARISDGIAPGDPVFRLPDDLQRVRGIGPKTVERMAPELGGGGS